MAEYKMADDFDDRDKGTQLQIRYDKLMAAISAKDMNISPLAVNALKEQIVALSQLAGLAGISLDIGALESALIVRESEVEFQYSKTIKETYSQDNKELTEEEQERVNKEKKVGDIYKKFDSFHERYLKEQKEDNKNLDKVLEATEAGRELTEKEKKKLKKTPEQIEEERLRLQHIELTNKEAEEEHKYHSENIEKINHEILNLDHHHQHEQIAILAQKKKHHEHHRDLAETKKTECAEHYHERKERAKKICKGLELAKQKGVNEGYFQDEAAIFHELHGIAPKEIAQEMHTDIPQKQSSIIPPGGRDSSLLGSPAVLPSQQELDAKQIIPDPDKETSKIEERVCNLKKRLGGGNEQKTPSQETDTNIKPDPTPPNLKESNKVKGQGTGRAGRL